LQFSKKGPKSNVAKRIVLEIICAALGDSSDQWTSSLMESPQQTGIDCIAFAGMFAWGVVYELVFDLPSSYARAFRMHMGFTLMQGYLHCSQPPKNTFSIYNQNGLIRNSFRWGSLSPARRTFSIQYTNKSTKRRSRSESTTQLIVEELLDISGTHSSELAIARTPSLTSVPTTEELAEISSHSTINGPCTLCGFRSTGGCCAWMCCRLIVCDRCTIVYYTCHGFAICPWGVHLFPDSLRVVDMLGPAISVLDTSNHWMKKLTDSKIGTWARQQWITVTE